MCACFFSSFAYHYRHAYFAFISPKQISKRNALFNQLVKYFLLCRVINFCTSIWFEWVTQKPNLQICSSNLTRQIWAIHLASFKHLALPCACGNQSRWGLPKRNVKQKERKKKMIKAFAPFACKFVFGVALLMGILIGAGCSTFAPTSSLFWVFFFLEPFLLREAITY